MGAVLVILRDGDGALDVEVFFINLVSATPIDLTWLLVLGIAAGVIGLVGVILNRRLRGWRGSKQPARAMFRDTYEPDVIDNRRKMRYCPYCAAEIRVRTRYCPYCGECIDFT